MKYAETKESPENEVSARHEKKPWAILQNKSNIKAICFYASLSQTRGRGQTRRRPEEEQELEK